MKILIIENGYRDLVNSRFPLGSYLEKEGNSLLYACPNPEKDSTASNKCQLLELSPATIVNACFVQAAI